MEKTSITLEQWSQINDVNYWTARNWYYHRHKDTFPKPYYKGNGTYPSRWWEEDLDAFYRETFPGGVKKRCA